MQLPNIVKIINNNPKNKLGDYFRALYAFWTL